MPAVVVVGSTGSDFETTATFAVPGAAGDLLIMNMTSNSNTQPQPNSPGWIVLRNQLASGVGGSATLHGYVAYKVSAGETSMQNSHAGAYACVAYRNVEGSPTNPTVWKLVNNDNPELQVDAGSGGVGRVLWCVLGFDNQATPTGAPSGYTTDRQQANGSVKAAIFGKATSGSESAATHNYGTAGNSLKNYHSTYVFLTASNITPNVPTNLSPSGATGVNNVTLSAVVSDPDGDNVYAAFEYSNNGGSTWIQINGTTVASGGTSTVAFGGAANTTYTLRARAIDPRGLVSGYTASQTFTTNRPPTTPGIPTVSPNPVNTNGTISWTASTDADGQAINYDVDLSTNGGSTWKVLSSNAATNSLAYNFGPEPSTSTAQIRVRAEDTQGAFSAYATSANFTIQHNQAPNAATWVGPPDSSSLDRAQAQLLDWTFVDPDAGDTQSKYDLRYRVGAGAWTTITTVTTATDHTFAANALAANDYEFQVLTYDAQGVPATAWSASKFLTFASQPGTPTVTAPSNGATIPSSTGVLAWSTGSQSSFQVRKTADLAGVPDTATILFDSGEVMSASQRDYALSFPVNNRTEHLQIRTRSSGLWSPWGSVKVLVSYTAPASPTARVSSGVGEILVTPVDGFRQVGQPAVSYHDIYRRVEGTTGPGERLATGFINNQVWFDGSVQHRTEYEYKVIAVASNGTSSSSEWYTGRPFADLTPTFTS